MAYDHGAFRVRRLDQAIKFYTEKLGFTFLFDGENEKDAERYAFLEYNGARIELIETIKVDYQPRIPERPFCPHLCFETNDIESDPSEIVEIYRKRWEIELLFKRKHPSIGTQSQ